MTPTFVTVFALVLFYGSHLATAAIHLPLSRRGGRFSKHELVNLSRLSEILGRVEARYARAYREVEGNRLVRRWRMDACRDENDPLLLGAAGHDDQWFTELRVGDPPQTLELDIDMLSPDFYTIATTSGQGSIYNHSRSRSHGPSDQRVHSVCRWPSEEFHFPQRAFPARLNVPMCTPSKSSRQTLAKSGTMLGLAPPHHLARLPSPSLIDQLVGQSVLEGRIWSLTLLDTETGILSLGGTIARQAEEAKMKVDAELKNIGDPKATSEWVAEQVREGMKSMMPTHLPWDHHFKWTAVQGAQGWWTGLMAGVWVNGAKVLSNQPVLLDVNVPFILAPPVAAQRFYEAIGGAKRLPQPHDSFFAIPCLNRVNIACEIGGWNFPCLSGAGTSADALFGPAGGRMSLGKLADGTGYCIGIVVETKMGLRKQWMASGVKDMWVLGEPFLSGLGLVFDPVKKRIGLRSY